MGYSNGGRGEIQGHFVEASGPTERQWSLGGSVLLLLPRIQALVLCSCIGGGLGWGMLAGPWQHSVMVLVCLGHLVHVAISL